MLEEFFFLKKFLNVMLTITLPQCWDYRNLPPWLALFLILNRPRCKPSKDHILEWKGAQGSSAQSNRAAAKADATTSALGSLSASFMFLIPHHDSLFVSTVNTQRVNMHFPTCCAGCYIHTVFILKQDLCSGIEYVP